MTQLACGHMHRLIRTQYRTEDYVSSPGVQSDKSLTVARKFGGRRAPHVLPLYGNETLVLLVPLDYRTGRNIYWLLEEKRSGDTVCREVVRED